MSFTHHELKALHRDLSKWVRSCQRHLAAESGADGPHLSGDSGPVLAELCILIAPHEATMLTRLADEIPDLPAGMAELDRMRAALRYSFHFVFRQTFGEPP